MFFGTIKIIIANDLRTKQTQNSREIG
jgi:hypothetical protein